jgi:acyl-coenzyme A thioesterase PaaI-like protein
MGPAVFAMTEGRLYTATVSMTVNFIAPAEPGPIVGEAWVVQLGRTIAFTEGRLNRADGLLIATASANARLLESARALR